MELSGITEEEDELENNDCEDKDGSNRIGLSIFDKRGPLGPVLQCLFSCESFVKFMLVTAANDPKNSPAVEELLTTMKSSRQQKSKKKADETK